LNAALAANSTYTQGFNALQENTALPADTRAAYLQNLIDTRNSQYDMIQQIYGIKLDWGQGGGSGGPAAPVTAPTASYTSPTAPATLPPAKKKDDILQTLISPISTKTGRGLLTNGLSSLF
jgi:hypothetical protein